MAKDEISLLKSKIEESDNLQEAIDLIVTEELSFVTASKSCNYGCPTDCYYGCISGCKSGCKSSEKR